ncbi:MAG: hypothetical protein NC131_08205 [Roseburia sp.]|nr:hypothetical protein [Roseburia sp.]
MDMEKITPETEVSTSELACVLGITGRRIRQLAEDGQLERVSQGRFNLADAVQRYIAGLSRETTSAEEAKLERAKRQSEATLKMSKAEIARLEMKELQGKMHRSEDVAAMTEDLIYTIRSALMALPGRLAVDVCSAQSPAEASEIIRKEAALVMQELAAYRYDPKKYEERVRERRSWDSLNGRDDDDE